jgi:RHS repeat-associated protein
VQKDAVGNWEHPLQDGLGSVRTVTDNAGAVLWATQVEPYGTGFGNVGTAQTNYGFTGEYGLPGGLVHLRARNYHPGLGVFASLDPFEGMMGRAMSLNGYGWVEGNVVNAIDPSGQNSLTLDSCGTPISASCPAANSYIPAPDYSKRLYVDTNYATYMYEGMEWVPNPPHTGNVVIMLSLLASRAHAAGNVKAARNLNHWLFGSGSPLNNYEVDEMIQDLPRWRLDITEQLNLAAPGIISSITPVIDNTNYEV